jgi:hypothetical protein
MSNAQGPNPKEAPNANAQRVGVLGIGYSLVFEVWSLEIPPDWLVLYLIYFSV